jgi:hypothetical protein
MPLCCPGHGCMVMVMLIAATPFVTSLHDTSAVVVWR